MFILTFVDLTLYFQAQSSVITAFKELTVKLNEAAFKPLFRRLFDWAFVEDPGGFSSPNLSAYTSC